MRLKDSLTKGIDRTEPRSERGTAGAGIWPGRRQRRRKQKEMQALAQLRKLRQQLDRQTRGGQPRARGHWRRRDALQRYRRNDQRAFRICGNNWDPRDRGSRSRA